jgi:ATP-binding protein involved in chromosome partitioning
MGGTLKEGMPVTESEILAALRNVIDPDLHRDIVTLNFVKSVEISDTLVRVTVELTTPACPVKDQLKAECEKFIEAVAGGRRVEVSMTARVASRPETNGDLIPGVKKCIAIASGKGGVGKSTVTVNLAVSLARTGAKVGLMDADVYGPTIPLLMGAQGDRPLVTETKKIVPIQRYGVHMMSLGFLMDESQAVLWRGPMVAGTIKQLLGDVDWGELDYLLVDLPPGTGDAPMSLAQLTRLTGVVIVTTPNQVATSIAAKSAQLFRRLNSPIIGVVENMKGFACESCGAVTQIFPSSGGEDLASKLHVPFLGSIPLDPKVSEAGERGLPSVVAYPERAQAVAFATVAGHLAQQASIVDLSS